jgi:hypothetical protein
MLYSTKLWREASRSSYGDETPIAAREKTLQPSYRQARRMGE